MYLREEIQEQNIYVDNRHQLELAIVFQSIYMYICVYIKTNLCQLSASVAQKNEGHTYFLEVKVKKTNTHINS